MTEFLAFYVAVAGAALVAAFMYDLGVRQWFPNLPEIPDRLLRVVGIAGIAAQIGGVILALLVLQDAWHAVSPLRITG